jgi:ELWxxDGT repeat protein
LYLAGNDCVHGTELWTLTDPEGTLALAADVFPGDTSSSPRSFVRLGDSSVFTASDDSHGREIWSTDGTAAGTFLLADINPGLDSSDPQELTAAGGLVYFSAADGAHGRELWRTDGTSAGTQLIADIGPTSGLESSAMITALNDQVLFFADDGTQAVGGDPWVSDGTPAGTFMLADVKPGSRESSEILDFVVVGGQAYFFPNFGDSDAPYYGVLWRTDGTAEGTQQVVDIRAHTMPMGARDGTRPIWGVAAANGFYFLGYPFAPQVGEELWFSDGTAEGTRMVMDIGPGTLSGAQSTRAPVFLGGRLYFAADDGESGVELWSTDGTEAGTRRELDINTGEASSNPKNLMTIDDTWLVFSADSPDGQPSLWAYDGSTATRLQEGLDTSVPVWGWDIIPSAEYSGRLYFSGFLPETGWEVWSTDGSAPGTRLEVDIAPGPAGSLPADFLTVAGAIFFAATDAAGDREPWAIDQP